MAMTNANANAKPQSEWVSFSCTVERNNDQGADYAIQRFWRPLNATEGSFKRLCYPDRLRVAMYLQSYHANFPVETVAQKYERRRLQRLAKAHGIRANAKSSVIVNKLRQRGVCLKSAVSRSRKRKRTPSANRRAQRMRITDSNLPMTPLDTNLANLERNQAVDPAANLPGEEGSVESLDGSSLTYLQERNSIFASWAPPAWDRFLLGHIIGAGAGKSPLPRFLVWMGSRLLLKFVPAAGPPSPANRPSHVRTACNGEICPVQYGQDAEAMQSLMLKVGSAKQELRQQKAWGENSIDFPVPGVLSELWSMVARPLLLLQLFGVFASFSCGQEEYDFATPVIMALAMLAVVWYQAWCKVSEDRDGTEKERKSLNRGAEWFQRWDTVERVWKPATQKELRPGDICRIQRPPPGEDGAAASPDFVLSCDLLLMHGRCQMNEAHLTGETTPIPKSPLEEDGADVCLDPTGQHRPHILRSGSRLHECAESGLHLYVLRTGAGTEQGQLRVRAFQFKLRRGLGDAAAESAFVQLSKMTIGLAVVAGLLPFVAHWLWSSERLDTWALTVQALVLVAAVTREVTLAPLFRQVLVAQNLKPGLENDRAPFRNIDRCKGMKCDGSFLCTAGRVSVCCLDKTGTITFEDVTLRDVDERLCSYKQDLTFPPPYCVVVGGCHSVGPGGGQGGDQEERAALESLGWDVLSETVDDQTCLRWTTQQQAKWYKRHSTSTPARDGPDCGITIVKTYHFDTNLKRMSAVVEVECSGVTETWVVCKGAPEVIVNLLRRGEDAELIRNRDATLSARGYRVLAMAFKPLTTGVRLPSRAKAEVLCSVLPEAGIRWVMITGDAEGTAAAVAGQVLPYEERASLRNAWVLRRQANTFVWAPMQGLESPRSARVPQHRCYEGSWSDVTSNAMLDKFSEENAMLVVHGDALHGVAEDRRRHEGLRRLSRVVRVWARHTASHKTEVIRALQSDGRVALMCGDGFNDTGALSEAKVGLSISKGTRHKWPVFLSGEKDVLIEKLQNIKSQGDRTPEVLSAILKLPSAYTRRPLESLPQSEAKRRAEAINTLARFTAYTECLEEFGYCRLDNREMKIGDHVLFDQANYLRRTLPNHNEYDPNLSNWVSAKIIDLEPKEVASPNRLTFDDARRTHSHTYIIEDKNGFCRDVNKDVRRHELRVAPDMTVLSMGASTFKFGGVSLRAVESVLRHGRAALGANYFLLNYATLASFTTLISNVLLLQLPDRCSSNVLVQVLWVYTLPFFMPVIPLLAVLRAGGELVPMGPARRPVDAMIQRKFLSAFYLLGVLVQLSIYSWVFVQLNQWLGSDAEALMQAHSFAVVCFVLVAVCVSHPGVPFLRAAWTDMRFFGTVLSSAAALYCLSLLSLDAVEEHHGALVRLVGRSAICAVVAQQALYFIMDAVARPKS